MHVHARGRECEPLGSRSDERSGGEVEKSSLVCCDGRVVLFLSPAFCPVDSSMLKNVSVFVAMDLAGSCVDS